MKLYLKRSNIDKLIIRNYRSFLDVLSYVNLYIHKIDGWNSRINICNI